MVRALLDGSKTQTRRVVKHAPTPWNPAHTAWDMNKCQYGQVGDQLWVREAFRTTPKNDLIKPSNLPVASSGNTLAVPFWYDADIEGKSFVLIPANLHPGKYRPGMFMPKTASRITLEITGVRVERLQDISEADAIAEGIDQFDYQGQTSFRDYSLDDEWAATSPMLDSPIASYKTLWETINGAGSWDLNPWVWVVEFKKVKP